MGVTAFIRKNILRKFIDLRILCQKKTPPDEIIRIELLVAMCIICLTLGMTYIVAGLFLNISVFSILTYLIFFLTTIPTSLYLIKKGYHNIAKLVMLMLGTFFMVVKASSLGPLSGMNISMLIILFALFAFYSIHDYAYIISGITLIIGSIIFLEYTNYSFLDIDPSTSQYEYTFNYLSSIFFCILFFYVVLRINQYNNNKLSRLNNKLLSKNRKLAKINVELDSYVYRASHDMRAPLTSLMGILNMVKAEDDIQIIKKLVALQEKCVSKLDGHIRQIIDLSKNVRTEVYIQKIDLNDMIREVFDDMNFFEHFSKTKITIHVQQEKDFYSDPYRVKMILNNLVINSFKYVRKESEPEIELTATLTDNNAVIIIKDNGIGIPTHLQNKIFNMFYRATDKSTGSGLGLYIVKEMILKLKGSIAVRSEENVFTEISLVLPNAKTH